MLGSNYREGRRPSERNLDPVEKETTRDEGIFSQLSILQQNVNKGLINY